MPTKKCTYLVEQVYLQQKSFFSAVNAIQNEKLNKKHVHTIDMTLPL